VTIRPREQYEALQAARSREATAGYKVDYGKRAGVAEKPREDTRISAFARLMTPLAPAA
jgi:hypothetical protein